MDISPIAFFALALIAIVFSVLVVLSRRTITSAFCLVLVLFAMAGIYATMGAHLLAGLQILVYAGAVMVLFVFVIMLLNAEVVRFDLQRRGFWFGVAAVTLCAAGAVLFGGLLYRAGTRIPTNGAFSVAAIEGAGGNARVLSEVLFSDYVLPFELTSFLLLVAIIGAVSLAKRQPRRKP